MKKGTGKSFQAKFLFVIAMSFGLLSQVNATENAAEKVCEPLKRLASLDLAGKQAVLVPVQVGSSRAYMILHLASPFSVIFSEAVDRFGFKRQPLNTSAGVMMGGVALKEIARFEGLKVGNITYQKAELLILPQRGAMGMQDGAPIIGSLALDAFSKNDFEVDIAHRKLNIYSQDHCPGKVVYWSNEYASSPLLKGPLGNFYFPMELEGKKIEATFDPQNPNTLLSTDVTKRLYDFDEKSQGNETVVGQGGQTSYFYRPMQITAPGLKISNTRVQLTKRVNK